MLAPKTLQVVGEYPVGSSPYTYSDMTGQLLAHFAVTKGVWRTRFFASDAFNLFVQPQPQVTWTKLDAQVDGQGGGTVLLRVGAAATEAGLLAAQWSAPMGPLPGPAMPLALSAAGAVLEVEVSLKAGGGVAPLVKKLTAEFVAK